MHAKHLAQSLAPSRQPIYLYIHIFFYLEPKIVLFEEFGSKENSGIQSFKPNPNHFMLGLVHHG